MPKHRFEACVGESLDAAWFVATRYETTRYASGEGADPARREYWIGRLESGGVIGELWATRTPLASLVRGRGGCAYVLADRGAVSGDTGEQTGVWRLAYDDDAIRVTPVADLGWFMHAVTALADESIVA